MPVIGRSMVLGVAFLAGIAIAADADPACRAGAGSCQSPGPQTAALPPANGARAPTDITLPQVNVFAPRPGGTYVKVPYTNAFGVQTMVEHYQMPPDYDDNPAMHPYTSGLGPWPGPGDKGRPEKPPSHYNH